MIQNGLRSRRGAVLIIVLGVLFVLALLATTFATLQNTERHVARNYTDTVRVKLVAQSGVDAAVARISLLLASGRPNDPSLHYWGNNVDEKGTPDWKTPLEEARNPSFAWEDEKEQNPTDLNVKPMIFTIEGKPLGVSGFMGAGSYAANGDLYRLRVADANSMIHLNDGLENGNDGYVSQNLKRILNNLGKVIGIPTPGDRILHARPAGGYLLKKELETVLGSADFKKLSPFVTTCAWVDSNVANPVPISRECLSSYPVKYNERLGIFRYGRSFGSDGRRITRPLKFAPDHANPEGFDHAVMALDELNPQWIEICRRAPVNVNAAPKEVLTALLTGLRGVFLIERRKQNPGGNMYTLMEQPAYENVPGGRQRGGEYGYLYPTVPFIAPG